MTERLINPLSTSNLGISTEKTISFAHIVDGSNKCGVIHGHNWNIKVTIKQVNDDTSNGMVLDFTEIKRLLMRLDHHLVISEKQFQHTVNGITSFLGNNKQYKVPMGDIVVLDIPYITAELLSGDIAEQVAYLLDEVYDNVIFFIEVSVEETPNNIAIFKATTVTSKGEKNESGNN